MVYLRTTRHGPSQPTHPPRRPFSSRRAIAGVARPNADAPRSARSLATCTRDLGDAGEGRLAGARHAMHCASGLSEPRLGRRPALPALILPTYRSAGAIQRVRPRALLQLGPTRAVRPGEPARVDTVDGSRYCVGMDMASDPGLAWAWTWHLIPVLCGHGHGI